ncbi:3-oxoacyl-[acyl-carrier-protein] reductase FabG [Novipirellula galeiformis]|uniref:3-oxoacyl-[acyl-carrier-protein] reductase FabG n=1 Tax=Novipirellula galeiformis TaxID=2528004 RepID=A0A5C6CEG1_9BACT|nr:SDR family oxidoreductase [Novipirellula galeiformis]TWU23283.1 3-oxoacyl-[acyl-carrier-protein] reductase FabG [Novipirellula galeiformis]
MPNNKTVIVTGGSGGIGGEICSKLANAGWKTVVHYHSDKESAEKVVAEIKAKGGKAFAAKCDLSDEQAVTELFDTSIAEFGELHSFVACAGIAGSGPVVETSLCEFQKLLRVNVVGAYLTIREAARRIEEGGRIVFISSQLAERPREGTGLYSATKAAMDAMIVSMSRELGSRRITINSVRPGATEPGMFANSNEERKEYFRNLSPFKRLGHPNDIAGVVEFLLSDDARWMTGQHLRVDGGASN